MLKVIRNHRRAAQGSHDGYEGLATLPVPLDHRSCPDKRLIEAAKAAWDKALDLGTRFGYRNAQVSVVAPTGTIGLVMDCDTTGIEPDFALVKFKKLAGGGYFKIINQAVPTALRTLGYRESEIAEIEAFAVGHGSIDQAPGINPTTLKARKFTPEAIAKVQGGLKSAFDIKFAFNKWSLGQEFCEKVLGFSSAELDAPNFDMLTALGFSKAEIDAANLHVCGAMTVEGAPFLKAEHHRQTVPLGREPHPHDGGGAALYFGCDLQDHQHAERCVGRGLQERLHAVLAPRAESQCALSRRLKTVAAAQFATCCGR
jgi:ribonucleoside-diphosphate reductase alpha chain